MQQLDEGWEHTISSFDICKLLLDFPTSTRRTRTSPVSLRPENQPLHDRLIRLLTTRANNAAAESERMAYSFWNSFAASERPFPVTADLQSNKLETWIHLHNFVKRRRSDMRHVRLNSFAYLIDPKATLKYLGIFKVTNIERVMMVLEADLDAPEEKAIEQEMKKQSELEKQRRGISSKRKRTAKAALRYCSAIQAIRMRVRMAKTVIAPTLRANPRTDIQIFRRPSPPPSTSSTTSLIAPRRTRPP